jgi:hypothetical protein
MNLAVCKEESQRIDIKRSEMEDHGDISPQWGLIFKIFKPINVKHLTDLVINDQQLM